MSFLYGKPQTSEKLQKIKAEVFGDLGSFSSGDFTKEKLRKISLPTFKMPSLQQSSGYSKGLKVLQHVQAPYATSKALSSVSYGQAKVVQFMTGKKLQVSTTSKEKAVDPYTKVTSILQNSPGSYGTGKIALFTRPDLKGENRIKQQELLNKMGLKPFDDYDKDGVANILDCDPFDKTKQGPGDDPNDNMNDAVKEVSSISSRSMSSDVQDRAAQRRAQDKALEKIKFEEQEKATRVLAKRQYDQDLKDIEEQERIEKAKEKLKRRNLADKAVDLVVRNPVARKIGDVVTGTTQEERDQLIAEKFAKTMKRQEEIDAIKRQAEEQAIKDATRAQALKFYQSKKRGAVSSGVDILDSAISQLDRKLGRAQVGQKFTSALSAPETFGSGISQATQVYTPQSGGVSAVLSYGKQTIGLSPQDKIRALTGGKIAAQATPFGQPQGYVMPLRPASEFSQGAVNVAPQFVAQQQGVYSPASKKVVGYTRGPYRKSQYVAPQYQ